MNEYFHTYGHKYLRICQTHFDLEIGAKQNKILGLLVIVAADVVQLWLEVLALIRDPYLLSDIFLNPSIVTFPVVQKTIELGIGAVDPSISRQTKFSLISAQEKISVSSHYF